MEAMKTATQLSPRNQTYPLNMARVYMAAKQWDDAAALLENLKTSQNPQVAQAAKKNLENLPTLKKYGVLPQAEVASVPPKPPDEQNTASKKRQIRAKNLAASTNSEGQQRHKSINEKCSS